MRSIFKILFSALLTIQFSFSSALADYEDGDGEVICDSCLDSDLRPGDIVEYGGVEYELDELGTVEGEPYWRVTPTDGGSGQEGNGYSFDDSDYSDDDRIRDRDFSGVEDHGSLSEREKEKLRELQERIIERINTETTMDSEATNQELGTQFASLNQAIETAGTLSYHGPSLPTTPMDPLASLYNSLETRLGNENFYIDQAGWQLFDDHTYQSDHNAELEKLRDRLNYHIPKSPQQADAKRAGYFLLNEADQAYLGSDKELGDALLDVSSIIVDIATDVIPLTSVPKDIFRAYVGKEPITGRPLQTWERVVAGVFVVATIVSFGASNIAATTVRAVSKAARVSEESLQVGVKIGKSQQSLTAARNLLSHVNGRLTNIRYLDAAKENQKLKEIRGYSEKAWDEKEVIASGKTIIEQKFVRLFNDEKSRVGSWVVEASQVKGKTPDEIQQMLALSYKPDKFTVVTLPKGTDLYIGFLSTNKWGGNNGTIQYFIPEAKGKFFGNTKHIKGTFGS